MKIKKIYVFAMVIIFLYILFSFIQDYLVKYRCELLINSIDYKICLLNYFNHWIFSDFVSILYFLSVISIIFSIAKFWSDLFYFLLQKFKK